MRGCAGSLAPSTGGLPNRSAGLGEEAGELGIDQLQGSVGVVEAAAQDLGVLGSGVLQVAEPLVQDLDSCLAGAAVALGCGEVAGEPVEVVAGLGAPGGDDPFPHLVLIRERDAGEVAPGAEAADQFAQPGEGGGVAAVDEVHAPGGAQPDRVQVLEVGADDAAQPVAGQVGAAPPLAAGDVVQHRADLLLLGFGQPTDGVVVWCQVQGPCAGPGAGDVVAAEDALGQAGVIRQAGLACVAVGLARSAPKEATGQAGLVRCAGGRMRSKP